MEKCVNRGDVIFWENKRFFSYNYFLKQKFGEKVFKIPVSLATTCPNRDGKKAHGGCIFCSENGSGDFLIPHNVSIKNQIEKMVEQDEKWNANKYIVYFQSFTNTYLPVEVLRKAMEEALLNENVVGISIGTRVDCISDDMLSLLAEFNKKTFLNIELGLQTSKDKSHELVNSQFVTKDYQDVMKRLKKHNIFVVTHVIIGLPFETKDDIKNTVSTTIKAGTNGIKLQLLYILKDTKLHQLYTETNFDIFTFDEYVDLIIEIIENLPKDIVIMRLTGDGKKEDVIAPLFSLNKRKILNAIDSRLKERNSYQSKNLIGSSD